MTQMLSAYLPISLGCIATSPRVKVANDVRIKLDYESSIRLYQSSNKAFFGWVRVSKKICIVFDPV